MVVADDDVLVRDALSALIEAQPDLTVAGVAADAEQAIELAGRLAPDLVLLDVSMPGGGDRAARAIGALVPETRLVALSGYEDPAAVRTMLRAGVDSYVVKSASAEDLLTVLRDALEQPPRRRPGPSEDRPPRANARPPAAQSITVLIAEENPDVLEALSEALEGDADLEIVGLAQTPGHASSLAARYQPAVALVDPAIMAGGGARAAAEIRACSPHTAVVALSAEADRQSVLEMVGSGASGYILKGGPMDELRESIRRAAAGDTELSSGVVRHVVEELSVQLHASAERQTRRRDQHARLDRALAYGLRTLVQPVVDLDDRRAVGFEALTRFDLEPRRRPDLWFIEAAGLGRAQELELAAARRALDRLDRLPDDAWLSINLSPEVASCDEFQALLAEHPADRVVLEMTEHAPVDDYDALGAALNAARSLGARVAVDDAGAGFASLRHIVLLAPEFIKLDVSLCRGVGNDRVRRAMARALVSFAAETDITVIAEGVESAADISALRELEVHLGQGYELGMPAAI